MKSKLFLILFLISCATTFEKKILVEGKVERRKTLGISFLNYEEAISEGYYNETLEFLKRNREKIKGNSSLSYAWGKLHLQKGDLEESIKSFEEVINYTSPASPVYRQTLWNLSIAYYFKNDFLRAYELAKKALESGQSVDKGFLNFLKKAPDKLYLKEGDYLEGNFEYKEKRIPVLSVKLNDFMDEKAALDTGASLSFLSLSTAKKLNIEISDENKSQGFGFHGKIIPVWLSYLELLEMEKVKIRNVPVMIFRDQDLTFGDFKINVGLGYHLLKEGVLRLDFKRREFSFKIYEEKDKNFGNLILLGLRPGVEVTINGAGYYNFILDTGSESTYITTAGRKKALLSEKLNLFDVITRGIGKAKVEYRKIEDATVGLGRYKIWYSNLLIKGEEAKYVDGILGNDFLENFKITIDFPKNRISIML